MLEREMKSALQRAASEYPVVTLIGPRQAGKSTLARATFQDKPYVNLEDPELRRVAMEEPQNNK
jgi:hypothetical protein